MTPMPNPTIRSAGPGVALSDDAVLDEAVSSAEIEWSYREDDHRYPRDFWHARISFGGFSTGWTSYGKQEQRALPPDVKAEAESGLRAELREMLRPVAARTAAAALSAGAGQSDIQAGAIEYFLRQKYVLSSDERQRSMGLEYLTAEIGDLARGLSRFVNAPTPVAAGAPCPCPDVAPCEEKCGEDGAGEACPTCHSIDRNRCGLPGEVGCDHPAVLREVAEDIGTLFEKPAPPAEPVAGLVERLNAAYVGEDLEIMGGKFLRPTNLGHEAAERIAALEAENGRLAFLLKGAELLAKQWQAQAGASNLACDAAEADRDRLREARDELQQVFDLRWAADQRAIEMWREGHPDRDLKRPDHADLVVWLLDRETAAEEKLVGMREALQQISKFDDDGRVRAWQDILVTPGQYALEAYNKCADIARAALAPASEDQKGVDRG